MRDLEKDLDICNAATPGPWKRNVRNGNAGKPYWQALWACQQALAEVERPGDTEPTEP